MTRRLLVLCFALAACGGDSDPDPTPGDSAVAGDAPAATVMTVACPGGEAATIETTGGFRFMPKDVTITVGQVVKFENGSNHNVVPGANPTDSGLRVPAFGATGCLMFTQTGTFNFKCQPHPSMTGSVTVN